MSLRSIAKQLGISPAYLSMMVNGKRRWRPDLYQRYQYFVNTSVNTHAPSVNSGNASAVGVYGAGDPLRIQGAIIAE